MHGDTVPKSIAIYIYIYTHTHIQTHTYTHIYIYYCIVTAEGSERACNFSVSVSLSAAATAAKSLQSCPTLCDPIDGSPLGSSVPGILQARILEWVAISFSNA